MLSLLKFRHKLRELLLRIRFKYELFYKRELLLAVEDIYWYLINIFGRVRM